MELIPQKKLVYSTVFKFHFLRNRKADIYSLLHSCVAWIALFGRVVRGVPLPSEHCSGLWLEPAQVLAAAFQTTRFCGTAFPVRNTRSLTTNLSNSTTTDRMPAMSQRINSACVLWVTQTQWTTPESDHDHSVYLYKMSVRKHVGINLILLNLSRCKFIWAQTPSGRTEYPAKGIRKVTK